MSTHKRPKTLRAAWRARKRPNRVACYLLAVPLLWALLATLVAFTVALAS